MAKKPSSYDMTKRNERALTPLQLRFIYHYLSAETLFNGVQSAIAAGVGGGYSGCSGYAHKAMRNFRVAKEINRRLIEMYAAADLTIESVLARIEQVYQSAMRMNKHSSALRAVELQGRYLKMFVDRIEHLHTIEKVTDAELTSMLKAVIGNVPGLSFNELMEEVGAQSDSGPDRDDGPAQGGVPAREGDTSAE